MELLTVSDVLGDLGQLILSLCSLIPSLEK